MSRLRLIVILTFHSQFQFQSFSLTVETSLKCQFVWPWSRSSCSSSDCIVSCRVKPAWELCALKQRANMTGMHDYVSLFILPNIFRMWLKKKKKVMCTNHVKLQVTVKDDDPWRWGFHLSYWMNIINAEWHESQTSDYSTVSALHSVSVSCSFLAPTWLLAELGLLTVTALPWHNGLTVHLALRETHRQCVFVFWKEDSHSQPERVGFCHFLQQHLDPMTFLLEHRTVGLCL